MITHSQFPRLFSRARGRLGHNNRKEIHLLPGDFFFSFFQQGDHMSVLHRSIRAASETHAYPVLSRPFMHKRVQKIYILQVRAVNRSEIAKCLKRNV